MRVCRNILIGTLFISSILLLNACTVVVRNHPHAPVQTHTAASFQYWYYYPNSEVYYHITEHYYYYPYRGTWRRVKRLPQGWVLNHADRVRLRISGKPYIRHAQHQREYPRRNTAVKHPHRRDHEDRRNGQYGKNRNESREYPEENAKKQKREHNPHHNTNGGSENREQHRRLPIYFKKPTPPGHAESTDVPNKKRWEHAKKPPHHEDKQNRDHGQPVVKNPHYKPHGNIPGRKTNRPPGNNNAGRSKGNQPNKGNAGSEKYHAGGSSHGKGNKNIPSTAVKKEPAYKNGKQHDAAKHNQPGKTRKKHNPFSAAGNKNTNAGNGHQKKISRGQKNINGKNQKQAKRIQGKEKAKNKNQADETQADSGDEGVGFKLRVKQRKGTGP